MKDPNVLVQAGTGNSFEVIKRPSKYPVDERVWKDDIKCDAGGDECIVPKSGVHCQDDFFGSNNVYCGHAYSVLQTVEVDGRHFVKVRNPWGQVEWNGPWADGTRQWKTKLGKKLAAALGNFNGASGKVDDGVFVMSFEDFRQAFDDMTFTRDLIVVVDTPLKWNPGKYEKSELNM